jgi:hypothetical protein
MTIYVQIAVAAKKHVTVSKFKDKITGVDIIFGA